MPQQMSHHVTKEREKSFINDAIRTKSCETPVINRKTVSEYSALNDPNCKAYFSRPHVRKLLGVTLCGDVRQ